MTANGGDASVMHFEATWPYLAEEAEESLNPALIEHHARQILARSVVHGRLVAFLGAGVSMAYGRLSWADLVLKVLEAVAAVGNDEEARTPPINARIDTLVDDLHLLERKDGGTHSVHRQHSRELSGVKPLLVFQLCEEILRLAKAVNPRVNTLQEVFELQLKTPQGHDERFIDCMEAATNQQQRSESTKFLHWFHAHSQIPAYRFIDQPNVPRRHFLQLLCDHQLNGIAKPRDSSRHSNTMGSPIALLLHDFRVQRFATTNYDREIEAALRQAQRVEVTAVKADDGIEVAEAAPTELRQSSIVLGLKTVAKALLFAAEGRRRHAQVLHLHGSIDEADSIIASERDYQRQYLRHSKQRDLLDNTIRTLFGANPVLYVGSGITEEDVLRPLREFMSRAPRQGDRLGVALLPANAAPNVLALQKIECLVRYGIHVIHYGYGWQCGDAEDRGRLRKEAWLSTFTTRLKTFKARLESKAEGRGKLLSDAPFEHIKLPAGMEGQSVELVSRPAEGSVCPAGGAFAIDLEVSLFNDLAQAFWEGNEPVSAATRDFLNQLLDEIANSITTAFVCARLRTEADFRIAWAGGLVRPIEPVRTLAPVDEANRTYRHMTPDLSGFPGAIPNRFVQAWQGEVDRDTRWAKLHDSLTGHPKFTASRRRRVILLPFPRGAGKGSMFDHLTVPGSKALAELQAKLTPPGNTALAWYTAVVSLNFLSDVANMAEAIAKVIWSRSPNRLENNVAAALEWAMHARTTFVPGPGEPRERVLLVLGNAGVLFDRQGEPKNGQVLRLMGLLADKRFAAAPIDIVLLCDEAHVPWQFRVPDPDARESSGSASQRKRAAAAFDLGLWSASSDPRAVYERPNRLALRGVRMHRPTQRIIHVHAPARNRSKTVAWPFLKPLFPQEGGTQENGTRAERPTYPGDLLDDRLHALHDVVGGHRIALTLVLALGSEQCGLNRLATDGLLAEADRRRHVERLSHFIDEATTAVASEIHETAPETALQFVFDHWEILHLRERQLLQPDQTLAILGAGTGETFAALWMREDANEWLWRLSKELLWHLAVLSHPVELSVLLRCPGIGRLADQWLNQAGTPLKQAGSAKHALIKGVAELCVHRCLAMRLDGRQLGAPAGGEAADKRYTVHRMVQRHFLRMMGGRNIEAVEWDQFTTSLYASQPDEIPALAPNAHAKIKALIRALSRYGSSSWATLSQASADQEGSVKEEYQALRAAYFVARSTYSVGVLSHIAAQSPGRVGGPQYGHMEEYRRLIRWITHRAESLQQRSASEQRANRHGEGFFHRGEIVWLYAECGVMSLTQGKLEDAEALLNLALRACKRVECDDTGSLHVRLLLHVALTRIERGRPRSARPLLEPIARRREGHQVPPLIAEFYLGMIDHLGGEYHWALKRYSKALDGFRQLGRTRATAFVLKSLADLQLATDPDNVPAALAMAQDAMAVAQRGGHEDVRMLAALAVVRIRVKGRRPELNSDSFQLLDTVGLYGAEMGMPRMTCAAHEVRASLLMSQGETIQSAREASTSAEIAALYDLKLFKCKALLTLAGILAGRGDREQATDIVRTGLEMAHAAEYFTCVRGFRALMEGGLTAPDGMR